MLDPPLPARQAVHNRKYVCEEILNSSSRPNSIKYIIAFETVRAGWWQAIWSVLVKQTLTPASTAISPMCPPNSNGSPTSPIAKTRRAYKIDVAEFIAFTGLQESGELRTVARAHVIAWRKDMESRKLAPASIRRKLSALSSLFDYLCERNAVARQSRGWRQAAGGQRQ